MVGMFHVEQCLIDELPTQFRSSFHQLVRSGREYLEGQGPQKTGALAQIFTVESGAKTLLIPLHAKAMVTAFVIEEFRHHHQGLLAMAHQRTCLPMAESPALAKQMNGFQDGGLSGPVWSQNQIDTGRELQTGGLEKTQILDLKPSKHHDEKRDAETSPFDSKPLTAIRYAWASPHSDTGRLPGR